MSLIVQFGLSQGGYPKLSLINQDTLVMFTPSQVRGMHSTFLELDKQQLVNGSLTEEIELYRSRYLVLTNQMDLLNDKSVILKRIAQEKDGQVVVLEEEVLKRDKKIAVLKKTRTLYTVLGVAAGFFGCYLLPSR